MKYNFCIILEKPKRVDMFLSALFADLSRSYIQKSIDKGCLMINGKIVSKNIKIKHSDEISLDLKVEAIDLEAQDIPLDIIYEDENILFINKDAGINVHPVPGVDGNRNTVVNAILYHCKDQLPTINGEQRPGIVHRLDKDTSGILMIAKNDKMMKYLSAIIKQREIDKYYIAIVDGTLKENKIKIESYIGRDQYDKTKMCISNEQNGRHAVSYVELLDFIDNKYSVVRVKIETGRTHQIRVHLSSIGHPILGDKVYGNKKVNHEIKQKYGLARQALHAYELQLNLYGKNKIFQGGVKNDMQKLLKIALNCGENFI